MGGGEKGGVNGVELMEREKMTGTGNSGYGSSIGGGGSEQGESDGGWMSGRGEVYKGFNEVMRFFNAVGTVGDETVSMFVKEQVSSCSFFSFFPLSLFVWLPKEKKLIVRL